jgi:hypothetical protein
MRRAMQRSSIISIAEDPRSATNEIKDKTNSRGNHLGQPVIPIHRMHEQFHKSCINAKTHAPNHVILRDGFKMRFATGKCDLRPKTATESVICRNILR